MRNHGFLLEKDGWRLAPAFDINPDIDQAEHVLLDGVVKRHRGLDGATAGRRRARATGELMATCKLDEPTND